MSQLQNSVRRFEIHLIGSFDFDYCRPASTSTIQHFLFDASRLSFRSTCSGDQPCNSHLLMTAIKLMQSMPNIRDVRFSTNENNWEELLDAGQWATMALQCLQLEKVVFKLLGSLPSDQSLAQQTLILAKRLSDVRKTIQFRLIRT